MRKFKLPPIKIIPQSSTNDTTALYHGSTSASLLAYTETFEKTGIARGSLVPTQVLMEHGFVPFSGELGNTYYEKSVNKNAISTTPYLGTAKHYTKLDTHSGTDDKLDASDNIKESLVATDAIAMAEKLKDKAHALRQKLRLQFNETEKKLLDKPFRVIYEFRDIPRERQQFVTSDEVCVVGGIKPEEINKIYVPAEKIEFVQGLVGNSIAVLDIDVLLCNIYTPTKKTNSPENKVSPKPLIGETQQDWLDPKNVSPDSSNSHKFSTGTSEQRAYYDGSTPKFRYVQEYYLDIEHRLRSTESSESAAFLKSFSEYQGVTIADYNADMSLEGMYKLSIDLYKNKEWSQLGALSRHINDETQRIIYGAETQSNVAAHWNKIGQKITDVTLADTTGDLIAIRPVSQAMMLYNNLDADMQGRCWGLSHAFAVAYNQGGQKAVDNLVRRVEQAGDFPLLVESRLFKDIITDLQGAANNGNEGRQATYTLADVKNVLSNATQTTAFEIGTPNHMMTVAVRVEDGVKNYTFFDANGAQITNATANGLYKSMASFLDVETLKAYGLSGDLSNDKFEFVELDTKMLADKLIGDSPIKIKDLSGGDRLVQLIGNHLSETSKPFTPQKFPESNNSNEAIQSLGHDRQERLTILNDLIADGVPDESIHIAQDYLVEGRRINTFFDRISDFYALHNLDPKLMPVFG